MTDDRKNQIQTSIGSASLIEDTTERSRKYRNIVGILSWEATRTDDPWFLEQAIKIAELVTEDPSKAFLEIIKAMAKIGVKKKDGTILIQALEKAKNIDNDLDLSVALYELVIAFAKLEMKEEHALSYSLDLASKIPLDTYRSSALRKISYELVKSNPEKALQLLETSISIIENCETEPVYLASALCEIAHLLALLNDRRSLDFIKRAFALADGIVDDFEKSSLLLKIVENEIAIAGLINDEDLVNEAGMISQGITREYYKTLALNAIKTKMA